MNAVNVSQLLDPVVEKEYAEYNDDKGKGDLGYFKENLTIDKMIECYNREDKLDGELVHRDYATINNVSRLFWFSKLLSVNDVLRQITNNTLGTVITLNETMVKLLKDQDKGPVIDVAGLGFALFWWGSVCGLFCCLLFVNQFCDDSSHTAEDKAEEERLRLLEEEKEKEKNKGGRKKLDVLDNFEGDSDSDGSSSSSSGSSSNSSKSNSNSDVDSDDGKKDSKTPNANPPTKKTLQGSKLKKIVRPSSKESQQPLKRGRDDLNAPIEIEKSIEKKTTAKKGQQ